MARRTSGRVSAFRRTPLFAAIACALAQGALAGTFYVDNGNDSGGGSLRQAINDANNDCAVNRVGSLITFRNGPFTIRPSSPLPDFNCAGIQYNVTLDGSSQGVAYGAVLNTDPTGFNATFGVTVDGSLIPYGNVCGLQMIDNGYGGQLGVQGMEIINFNYGGSGTGLCGNIYAAGNRLANNANGMSITAGSIIGTYLPGDRNVIVGSSGADRSAIELKGGYVQIENNFIGTRDGFT
ncbi:MAG TPA: hypothetical protein VM051_01600, partial [Usitatibacter sp.]|nr:hypothetical protein [Usitatibacter sp.]